MNLPVLTNSTDLSLSCGNLSEAEDQRIAGCRYWMEGVLLAVVASFGLIGNSFSIYILSSEDMKNSFNHLLIVLACFDNLFLTFCLLDYCIAGVFQWPFSETGEFYALLFPKFLYPVNHITLSCSIFITVTIAFERYCAVCHPYTYRDINQTSSVSKRVSLYLVPVLVFSVLLNIPKFFETRIVYSKDIDISRANNFSSLLELLKAEEEKISFEMTELRDNPEYIRYYINYCRLLFTCFLPLTALTFFNFKIFNGIRYTHQRSGNSRREANLAVVLVCIVVVFVVTNIPRVIMTIHEWILTADIIRCKSLLVRPPWNLCLMSLNHLLLVVNASVNFLIYCSIGRKFKVSAEKVSSHRSRSSERREALMVRENEMMLTPMETMLQLSPSSADPTAITYLDNSDTN